MSKTPKFDAFMRQYEAELDRVCQMPGKELVALTNSLIGTGPNDVGEALLEVAAKGDIRAVAILQGLAFYSPRHEPLVLKAMMACTRADPDIHHEAGIYALTQEIERHLKEEVEAGRMTKVFDFKTGEATYRSNVPRQLPPTGGDAA
ncbi:hypothetical protein LMIY3S_03660 [Labrys miyagiensis]